MTRSVVFEWLVRMSWKDKQGLGRWMDGWTD